MFGKTIQQALTRVDPTSDITKLDTELAAEVSTLFRYNVPLDAIKQRGANERLLELLKSVHVRPFKLADVDAYKLKMARKHSNSATRAYWTSAPLGQYKLPVPQFALHTAVLLKKAEPECNIHIEYLQQVPSDPFMCVELHGAFQYVEYWEEAEFHGHRVV